MPYEIVWLVEKRVVYTRMYGLLTRKDMDNQTEQVNTYARQSEKLLHTITSATDVTGIDMGLRDMQAMQFSDIANLGWSITISPNKMHRFFATVLTQLTNKRGRQFATIEEGLGFLQEIDETLPPLKIPEK